ncbi:MAG: autotransporter domain-containing protein, partial [Actinobacteria bacterium]|nr:autotransporter domain-containing protein [Actinomycetota bacterium]
MLSGNNTYTGTTRVSGGTLQLGAADRIANTSALLVDTGATFDANNNADTVGSLAGAGSVSLGSATLTAGGDGTSTIFSGTMTGSGGLTKAGAGTLTISGSPAYTGATTISAGTIALSGTGSLPNASAVTVTG